MAKIRIYELAKELRVQPQELMVLLQTIGVTDKVPSSSIEDATARSLREMVAGSKGIDQAHSPQATAEGGAPEQQHSYTKYDLEKELGDEYGEVEGWLVELYGIDTEYYSVDYNVAQVLIKMVQDISAVRENKEDLTVQELAAETGSSLASIRKKLRAAGVTVPAWGSISADTVLEIRLSTIRLRAKANIVAYLAAKEQQLLAELPRHSERIQEIWISAFWPEWLKRKRRQTPTVETTGTPNPTDGSSDVVREPIKDNAITPSSEASAMVGGRTGSLSFIQNVTSQLILILEQQNVPQAANHLREALRRHNELEYRIGIVDCACCVEAVLDHVLKRDGETLPPKLDVRAKMERLENKGKIERWQILSIHNGVFKPRNQCAHGGGRTRPEPTEATSRGVLFYTCLAVGILLSL